MYHPRYKTPSKRLKIALKTIFMTTKKSNRVKGAYYLKKSIDLLKEMGYQTMKLETNKMTFINGRSI